MSFYEIPADLEREIDELDARIREFKHGRMAADELKSYRVPFGVYEQRRANSYMVRIRTPAGVISPAQLRAIAGLSARFASGAIHLTTRQEFQIHDVPLENVIPIVRSLLPHGLSTRGGGGNTVRNIIASPEAGVSRDEPFDVTPHVLALTSRLIAEPDSWTLPRKFKIAFSHSPRDTGYAAFNDLGFIAAEREGKRGFRVLVAGGLGLKPQTGNVLHEFCPEDEVYLVAEAVKRLFHRHGNRQNRHAARLRFLWTSAGETTFRQLYEHELAALREQNPAPLAIRELCMDSPAIDLEPRADTSAEFDLWKIRYAEEQKQPGLYSVLVPFFLGTLSHEQAAALADFLEPFGPQCLRATLGQNLRLRHLPGQYLANVFHAVRAATDLTEGSRLLGQSIACAGADTCKLGLCLSKNALAAVRRKLESAGLDLDALPDLKLNLSGCPNACGQHLLADLGFFGKVGRRGERAYPAYVVVAGARVGNGSARLADKFGEVSARDLPDLVCDFLAEYLASRERYGTFQEYLDAEGGQYLTGLCQRYSRVPEFGEDRNYYYDWGSTEAFAFAGRAEGECAG